jgi:5-methylcytosine-specific restriction endonuclease McrA
MKDCVAHAGRKCNALLAPTVETSIETNLPVAEIDHLVSRGIGGGTRDDRIKNLVTLCGSCHRNKHNEL